MRGAFGTNGKRGMVGDQGIDGIPGKVVIRIRHNILISALG
jgi:hypothetical protein